MMTHGGAVRTGHLMPSPRSTTRTLKATPAAAPPRRARGRRGFTLLEAAMATIILGVGVLAVVEAQQSFLDRNRWSSSGATASYLAAEIREMSAHFPRHDRHSGGLYFENDADPSTLRGWGPEADETDAEDLDDLDDLDGAVFGSAAVFPAGFTMSRRYAGPINAFAQVIPETLYSGQTEMFTPPGSDEPVEVAMRGWTQIVTVDKVEPTDFTAAVADNQRVIVSGATVRAVDRYPVRVTVTILRQPDPADPPEVMTTLAWIVTP
ncbi:MAG: hypothetical protein SFZ24_08715 [Planctomycetota bacterium]|nr:hypothetical protein [Planctomycetota bacterium]